MKMPAFAPPMMKMNQANRNMQYQNGNYLLRNKTLIRQNPKKRTAFALKQVNSYQKKVNKAAIQFKLKQQLWLNRIAILIASGISSIFAYELFKFFFIST
ncbi:MAG: hypothetical protein R2828_29120 [Saprospiraceae bacterium]